MFVANSTRCPGCSSPKLRPRVCGDWNPRPAEGWLRCSWEPSFFVARPVDESRRTAAVTRYMRVRFALNNSPGTLRRFPHQEPHLRMRGFHVGEHALRSRNSSDVVGPIEATTACSKSVEPASPSPIVSATFSKWTTWVAVVKRTTSTPPAESAAARGAKRLQIFGQRPLIHRYRRDDGPAIPKASQQIRIGNAVLLNRDAKTLQRAAHPAIVECRQDLAPRIRLRCDEPDRRPASRATPRPVSGLSRRSSSVADAATRLSRLPRTCSTVARARSSRHQSGE